MLKVKDYYRKSIRIAGYALLVYALLTATHLGEFWPFSIYPMFSQAGKPWERAVVRDVTDISQKEIWQATNQTKLIGTPVPLKELNINTNDIANYLSKNEIWTERTIEGLEKLFSDQLDTRDLLLVQVRGALTNEDTVTVNFYPYIYLSRDTTILSNKLKTH